MATPSQAFAAARSVAHVESVPLPGGGAVTGPILQMAQRRPWETKGLSVQPSTKAYALRTMF